MVRLAVLTSPLRFRYPLFTQKGVLWNRAFHGTRAVRAAISVEDRKECAAMEIRSDTELFWLVPLGLALWFLIWALWNWWREERR